MRILTKFDIRNNKVVKGINYEGVEEVGEFLEIYKQICNYISNNINKNFEIILNDVTASLFGIKSGEKNIKEILQNKFSSLPHICNGGIDSLKNVNDNLLFGCDRIMVNTSLYENIDLIDEIIKLYGSQILIPVIETRLINNDYYTYKCYGREDTGVRLIDWIETLQKKGIVEILLISIDKDGTLNGYDSKLLDHLKENLCVNKKISFLYAGGISDLCQIKDIEEKYSFINGVCISTLLYKTFLHTRCEEISYDLKKENIYFLSYICGNKKSVIDHYGKTKNCIIVNSIKDIPIDETICISGHYNTYILVEELIKNNNFYILQERLSKKTINYIGICAGLQLLLPEINDEFSDQKVKGLNILENCFLKKCDKPNIGFFNNKFYCHSYYVFNKNKEKVLEYNSDNIRCYQYHPENSN